MVDLMGKKWWFFILSTIIILPGVVSLSLYGLNLGIDFKGGTLLEYKFSQLVDKDALWEELTGKQLEAGSVVASGPDTYIIKFKPLSEEQVGRVKSVLVERYGQVEDVRLESVGPVIGGETTRNAFIALVLASLMIVLYLALAFRKVPKPASPWRFGITAVAALLHDVLVVVGLFSILGRFWGVEVDTLFVTALLTVIGFSVHDTIVVFDRIRENLPKHLSKSFAEVTNISLTQTLGRSLNTSLTTIFVLLAILLFGGESIRWFVVALLVGIISGTYSSIFNATALLALWEERLGH